MPPTKTIWMSACLAVGLWGCGATSGGGGGGGATPDSVSLDVAAFLREVGAETSEVLRQPAGSLEELEAARRESRGAERRAATQRVITAHAFAAEEASAADDARTARRHRRVAERLADAAVRGTRDRDLIAEVNFIQLWMTWRAGAAAAEGRAERYTTRHTQAGVLTTIAWMIRGEIAFENEDYDAATEAYRSALGQLGHPLYAFALLRTAAAHRALGEDAETSQALSEVEQLGCDETAHALVVRVATVAASENGTGLRRGADGVLRPASCPEPTVDEEEDEGWHPEE